MMHPLMHRRDFFGLLGGVVVVPFLPRPAVTYEMLNCAYDACVRGTEGRRMWITNTPTYEFGFTGFIPADAPVRVRGF